MRLVLAPIVAVAKENIVAAEEDMVVEEGDMVAAEEDSKIEASEGADVVTNQLAPKYYWFL